MRADVSVDESDFDSGGSPKNVTWLKYTFWPNFLFQSSYNLIFLHHEFYLCFTITHCSTSGSLSQCSFSCLITGSELNGGWRVTDSYCVLVWAALLSVKIMSRALPLCPNASAMTCLAMSMYDGAERSIVGLWGLDWVELLQTCCGGRDILHQRITSVHSHTPVPTLTFPTLILSDILGTRLCVIEAKREKWDMKCQLFWLWLCQAYPADKTGVYSLIQLPFLWRTKHGGFVYLVKIELLLGLLTLVSWLPFSASSWDRCRTLIV